MSGAGPRFDRVHQDFAKAGGDGTHFRLQARWQGILDGAEAFIDQVSGEINVRTLFEYHCDLGQTVAGY